MFLSLFLPTTCNVCIFKCFTDGPTGVWCVCACACPNAKQANITGRSLRGHLSLEVRERTGHGQFYLCKVNKFFLFHQADSTLFSFVLSSFGFFSFFLLLCDASDLFVHKKGGTTFTSEYIKKGIVKGVVMQTHFSGQPQTKRKHKRDAMHAVCIESADKKC